MKTTIVCTSQPAWWNSVRCPAWLGALGLVAALSTRAFAQTTIPHTVAISTNLPVIAGDGLLIEIFPNIGGGAAPTAADLEGLTPIGATLCPEVGFYRHVSASGPGSLDDFFAETTLLPVSLRGLNVSNFVLRITGLLKVTQAEDENPATPEIELGLGGSFLGGLALAVGNVSITNAYQTGVRTVIAPVVFESEGLYPVTLLYAADGNRNATLRFYWRITPGSILQLVEQSELYLRASPADHLVTFQEKSLGTRLADEFIAKGIRFHTLNGDLQITKAKPSEFVPVSPDRVYGEPSTNAAVPGELELSIVVPGTTEPSTTRMVDFFLIDAAATGATVTAYDPGSNVVHFSEYHGGAAVRERVTIEHPQIARVRITLGQGTDTTAIDSLSFSTPNDGPDLRVTNIEAPAQAPAGHLVYVSWTLHNAGNRPARAFWSDDVWSAANTNLDDAVEERLGTHYSGLAAGASVTVSNTVNFSAQSIGLRYLAVQTDMNGQVVETNERNNLFVRPTPIEVLAPDLAVRSFTVPAEASLGDTIPVQWALQNVGTAAIAPNTSWTDFIYLATNNAGSNATLLRTKTTTLSLAMPPATTNNFVADVPLPLRTEFPAGDYFLIVKAAWTWVSDPFKTNNSLAAPIRLALPELPDLAVTQITAPASVEAGRPAYLHWSVTNHTASAAPGPWTESVYLSADNQIGDDVFLGSFVFGGDLAGHGTVARSKTLLLPASLTGPRWFIVTTDSGDALPESGSPANNTLVAATASTVTAPDLVVESLVVPASARFGDTISVIWTVRNAGSAAAESSWKEQLVLWDGHQPSVSFPRTTLVTTDRLATLAPGASYTRTNEVKLPLRSGLAPGNMLLELTLDPKHQQPEANDANNITNSPAIAFTLPPLPDLAVTAVTAPAGASAGQTLRLTWAVTNRGVATAEAPWHEAVYLAATSNGTSLRLLTNLLVNTPLPAGVEVARTQHVTMPSESVWGNRWVVITTDSEDEVVEPDDSNNKRVNSTKTVFPASLVLQISPRRLTESPTGAVVRATVRRTGDRTEALEVTLTNSRPDKLQTPSTVNLPAGQAAAAFNLPVPPETVPDGTTLVFITASATNHTPSTTDLLLKDDDALQLSLDMAAANLLEGASASATVTRNLVTTNPLHVVLVSSKPTRLSVPVSVTIPANQASATFNTTALQNEAVEPSVSVMVTASALFHQSSSDFVTVLDNDYPALALSVSPPTFSESAGPLAALGLVSRSPVTIKPLIVQLHSSQTGKALVPATVTIPANQAAASFHVAAVDNAVPDGTNEVKLTAFVGNPTPLGAVTETSVAVLDDDGPALKLVLARKVVREGLPVATAATVTRHPVSDQPVAVQLLSSDTNEAVGPTSVIIPANAPSAVFDLTSLDDSTPDGSQTVLISAQAAGHTGDSQTLVVSDESLPDLVIQEVNAPVAGLAGQSRTLSFRLANQGLATFTGTPLQRIVLSTDAAFSSDDTALGDFEFTGTLAEGTTSGVLNVPLVLPVKPGDYWVFVYADATSLVGELLEDNNTASSPTAVHVSIGYTATVQTDISGAPMGTAVPIYGQATMVGSLLPASNVVVKLCVDLRGTRRQFELLTGDDGKFSHTFQPLPNEAGHYEVRALHPGVEAGAVQDEFTLFGMRFDPKSAQVKVVAFASVTNEFQLLNAGDVPLTSLTAFVQDAPANAQIEVLVTNQLPGSGSVPVQVIVRSLADASSAGQVRVRLTSVEGAVAELKLECTLLARTARLAVSPAKLEAGMVRGAQTLVELQVTNVGGDETGPLSVVLPNGAAWLQLANQSPLASLAPGASAKVTLLLAPPADFPLGLVNGALALFAAETSQTVPFAFNCISTAVGDLLVTAEDEFTFYAEGAPHVAGARVVLRKLDNGDPVVSGLTDTNGQFAAADLPAGWYGLEATADKHTTYRKSLLLAAGRTNTANAFLSRELVRYVWTVTPVEIEDRVSITIRTEFETAVPAPVITLEPNPIDLTDFVGEVRQVDVIIRNHGLIAANNLRLGLPQMGGFTFEVPTTELGTLAAQASFKVPMLIRKSSPREAQKGGGDCAGSLQAVWELLCGGHNNNYGASCSVLNSSQCGSSTPGCPGCGAPHSSSAAPPVHSTGIPGVYIGALPGEYGVENDACDCHDGFEPRTLLSYNLGGALTFVADAVKGWVEALPLCSGVEVAIDANGELRTCCQDDGGIGLEGAANGSASLEATFTPYGVTVEPPGVSWKDKSGNEIKANGELFAGVKVIVNGEASASATTGCNFSKLEAQGQAQMDVQVTAGVEAKVVWTISGPAVEELELEPDQRQGEVGGMLTLNVAGRISASYDSEVGGEVDACFLGAWLEGGVNVSTPIGNVSWPEEQKFYFVEPTCAEDDGDKPRRATPRPDHPMIIAERALQQKVARVNAQLAEARALYETMTRAAAASARRDQAKGGPAICARVKLQLDQDLVMTRSAFNASLELDNQSPDQPLQDVEVVIGVLDADGKSGDARFTMRPPELEGFTGSLGAATLTPAGTGRVSWLLIPTEEAAPETVSEYWVGGVLRYTLEGRRVAIPLQPAPITVYPDAKLLVKYFHQRDVFSDDPFTDLIEPAEPFALGLLVQNIGPGVARNVRISSGQPRIIENQKGLLIDFKIIGAQVGTNDIAPSLNVDLGQIDPGKAGIAQWQLVSSLHGQFIDYEATFEHTDALGGEHPSLVQSVEIHELIHAVRSDYPDDGRPDFLVNDIPNGANLPDTLYLSDGGIVPVQVVPSAGVSGTLGTNSSVNQTVTLFATLPAGWAYLRVSDPAEGEMRLVRVTRSDGREVRLNENVWVTDRTFIENGQRPIDEWNLHLLDFDGTATYTLEYAPIPHGDDTNAPVSNVNPLPALNPATFTVSWSGRDEDGGSDVAEFDVFVSTDGGPFQLWLEGTKVGAGIYPGLAGHNYAFYCVATDAAGNREAAPSSPDAETTTTGNTAPQIAVIPRTTLIEGESFTLQAQATDNDARGDKLAFSLMSAPSGMTIHPDKGVITWATGEDHGPKNYRPSVVVTDDGTPPLTTARQFEVDVREENLPPKLADMPLTFDAMEGCTLRVTFSATDADLPKQLLRFTLDPGAPAGATIQAVTGLLVWTPQENQGGQSYTLTARVTDLVDSPLSDMHRFTVTVAESNSAPVITALPDLMLFEGSTLNLPVAAHDNDHPTNSLAYALDAGAPAGAGIDPLSGLIAWSPSEDQWDSTNSFSVRVTDNGTPTRSALDAFVVITKRLKPGLNLPRRAEGGGWEFTLKGVPGSNYWFEVSDDLMHWTAIRRILASERICTVNDPDPVDRTNRYYRVVLDAP